MIGVQLPQSRQQLIERLRAETDRHHVDLIRLWRRVIGIWSEGYKRTTPTGDVESSSGSQSISQSSISQPCDWISISELGFTASEYDVTFGGWPGQCPGQPWSCHSAIYDKNPFRLTWNGAGAFEYYDGETRVTMDWEEGTDCPTKLTLKVDEGDETCNEWVEWAGNSVWSPRTIWKDDAECIPTLISVFLVN